MVHKHKSNTANCFWSHRNRNVFVLMLNHQTTHNRKSSTIRCDRSCSQVANFWKYFFQTLAKKVSINGSSLFHPQQKRTLSHLALAMNGIKISCSINLKKTKKYQKKAICVPRHQLSLSGTNMRQIGIKNNRKKKIHLQVLTSIKNDSRCNASVNESFIQSKIIKTYQASSLPCYSIANPQPIFLQTIQLLDYLLLQRYRRRFFRAKSSLCKKRHKGNLQIRNISTVNIKTEPQR